MAPQNPTPKIDNSDKFDDSSDLDDIQIQDFDNSKTSDILDSSDC